MLCNLLLGLVGGFLGAKLIGRRFGGGCGGHRWGGHGGAGRHGGWHRFGGRGAFFLLRSLHLDETQKAQARDLFHTARRAMGETRFGRMDLFSSLIDAARGDKFDRAAVDAASHKQAETESAARKEFLDKLELFMNGLTTEQRARVQEFIGKQHEAGSPDGAGGGHAQL